MNTQSQPQNQKKLPAKDNSLSIKQQIREKIKAHYNNNLVRSRLKFISRQDIKQKNMLNFSSNDYLGFAANREIISKAQELMPSLGIGSGASNMITGYHTIHQDLEIYLADLLHCDQAILFPSGFMANLAIADVLLNLDQKNSIAIHDHNNHASILDGSRLSGCKSIRFKHNDLEHLSVLLAKYKSINNKFIFTESLFSMDGDFAPLDDINNIINNHADNDSFCLTIDESHSFGLYNNGLGLSCHLANDNKLIMGTFGKAIGTAGAFIAGPKPYIELLLQFARTYIYTTALSPIITAATLHAIKLNQQTSEFREKLFNNIEYFCTKLKQETIFPPVNTNSPIQPIIIGDTKATLKAADFLYLNKIILTAIRPPTVGPHQSRLRLTLSANHTHEQIDYLISVLSKLSKQLESNL